ncbi:hypothetical protein ABIC08_009011 [Bradyrhizobium sp. RT9b]
MTPYRTPHADAGWHCLPDRAFNSCGANRSLYRAAPRSLAPLLFRRVSSERMLARARIPPVYRANKVLKQKQRNTLGLAKAPVGVTHSLSLYELVGCRIVRGHDSYPPILDGWSRQSAAGVLVRRPHRCCELSPLSRERPAGQRCMDEGVGVASKLKPPGCRGLLRRCDDRRSDLARISREHGETSLYDQATEIADRRLVLDVEDLSGIRTGRHEVRARGTRLEQGSPRCQKVRSPG